LSKQVLFVTSAQVSANPRLLKEVLCLFQSGFEIKVIWCPISPWADDFDKKLFANFLNIQWIKSGYHPKVQPIGYWYARIRQKFWRSVYKLVGDRCDAAIKSLVLFSQELTSIALDNKADLYIGHNLGALPAIVKASKKFNAKSVFDFEDYHRGELEKSDLNTRVIINTENRYIPHVSSITAASPSISKAYGTVFPFQSITTINNCFPLDYAIEQIKSIPQLPLKLFWFSQYVGKRRGLETVLKAMSFFRKEEITLTLLGSASTNIKQYFYNLLESYSLKTDQLVFLDTISEEKIASIASMHHIGLASEFAHNQNRDLCLTNKLFMYLLAGNATLATDTSAQKYFLKENQGIGSLYEQENAIDLSRVLKNYIDNPELLDIHRKNALQLGKDKYNWNIEKEQFLKNVEQVLAK
jgi:glycosyltransferase involved in cell wall biosynthesis